MADDVARLRALIAQDAPDGAATTATRPATASMATTAVLGLLCVVVGVHVVLQQQRWLATQRRADDDPLIQRFE